MPVGYRPNFNGRNLNLKMKSKKASVNDWSFLGLFIDLTVTD